MVVDWWTLAFQTVNVLILIWILGRFFFRPVSEIVAKRQAEAGRILADAAEARNEADAARAAAEADRSDIADQRDALIAEAKKEALLVREDLVAEAKQEGDKLRQDTAAALARDRAAAEAALIKRAGDLSVDIARRLVRRLPADVGLTAFLAGLQEKLLSLPPDARKALVSAAADEPVRVITAGPLSDKEARQVRDSLAKNLEADLQVEFVTDAEVLAGIELHARNTVVRNSWRGDLARIAEELRHGG